MAAESGQTTTPRQRLAEISNYFLNERAAPPRPAVQHRPTFSIGLLNHEGAALPHLLIADALATLGLHTIVDAGHSALRIEFLTETTPRTSSGPIVIKPYHQRLPSHSNSRDLLLLPVSATNTGLRQAYVHLKQLRDADTPLGITITDAPDSHSAQRSFHRFARAARDFLNRSVASFSFLDATCRTPAERLAGLIQAEYEHWHHTRSPANKQEKNHAQYGKPEY